MQLGFSPHIDRHGTLSFKELPLQDRSVDPINELPNAAGKYLEDARKAIEHCRGFNKSLSQAIYCALKEIESAVSKEEFYQVCAQIGLSFEFDGDEPVSFTLIRPKEAGTRANHAGENADAA